MLGGVGMATRHERMGSPLWLCLWNIAVNHGKTELLEYPSAIFWPLVTYMVTLFQLPWGWMTRILSNDSKWQWGFIWWLPVLFWKVTFLSFQVIWSSFMCHLHHCPPWLFSPVLQCLHVRYTVALPLSCARVFCHFLHCSFTFKSVSGHSYICHLYLTHFLQSEHLLIMIGIFVIN